jgi:hypothetical protein
MLLSQQIFYYSAEYGRPLSSVLNCGLAMIELTPTTCELEERSYGTIRRKFSMGF